MTLQGLAAAKKGRRSHVRGGGKDGVWGVVVRVAGGQGGTEEKDKRREIEKNVIEKRRQTRSGEGQGRGISGVGGGVA